MSLLSRHSPIHATRRTEIHDEDDHCPRCGSERFWTLDRGRRRCAQCRFDWTPGRLPLRLTRHEWTALLRWFARGMSSSQIAEETGLERKRVLRALTLTRQAIAGAHAASAPVGGSRTERPIVGITLERGRAAAVVVQEAHALEIRRAIRAGKRPVPPRDHEVHYDAVVHRGRFHRLKLAQHGAGIGELETFWAYLRQRLSAKGGIRRERLGLYLAEYSWRYNRRSAGLSEQVNELLGLLHGISRG